MIQSHFFPSPLSTCSHQLLLYPPVLSTTMWTKPCSLLVSLWTAKPETRGFQRENWDRGMLRFFSKSEKSSDNYLPPDFQFLRKSSAIRLWIFDFCEEQKRKVFWERHCSLFSLYTPTNKTEQCPSPSVPLICCRCLNVSKIPHVKIKQLNISLVKTNKQPTVCGS